MFIPGIVSSRPKSITYDADVEAIRAVLDFTGLNEAAWMAAINDLVVGTKADGNWDLDECHLTGIGNSLANALVDLRNPTRTVTPVNSPTLNAWASVEFNGTTQYVNTGCNPGDGGSHVFTRNDGGFGSEFLTDNDVGNAFAMGQGATSPNDRNFYNPSNASGNAAGGVNVDSSSAVGAVASSVGKFWAQRTASNAYALYRDNTSVGTATDASQPITSQPFFWGATNQNGALLFPRAGAQRHLHIGASRDAAKRAAQAARDATYSAACAAGFAL